MLLNNVKPGDRLIAVTANGSRRIVTVERVTPTFVIVGGVAYRKKLGTLQVKSDLN
jgi:hypothetical protein